MPRYHFNVSEGDGRDVITDTEGVVLSGERAARKKAIKLARVIVRDGLVPEPIENWKVSVSLRNGIEALSVPLARSREQSVWILLLPREPAPSGVW
jgi:uncharacterized protein DUF6894